MHSPTLQDVVQWKANVWQDLDPEIIPRGFLKCSISNALDGSQNDEIWNNLAAPTDDPDGESVEESNDTYHHDQDHGLDQQAIEALFESDSDTEFEGFEPD